MQPKRRNAMKKQGIKRLSLSKETLHRLEEKHLQAAAGATGESICWCITHICISEGYTGCVACNS
jgi:hypothetical protein